MSCKHKKLTTHVCVLLLFLPQLFLPPPVLHMYLLPVLGRHGYHPLGSHVPSESSETEDALSPPSDSHPVPSRPIDNWFPGAKLRFLLSSRCWQDPGACDQGGARTRSHQTSKQLGHWVPFCSFRDLPADMRAGCHSSEAALPVSENRNKTQSTVEFLHELGKYGSLTPRTLSSMP